MASIKRDVGRIHPELKDTVGIFDRLAYRWQYSEVFDDLLDYAIRQYLLLPTETSLEQEKRYLKKYTDEERGMFETMFKNLVVLTKPRVNLWAAPDKKTQSGWYDPLGSFYEEVSSDGKKSMMGQFFTPQHIVDMMCMITMGNEPTEKMQRGEPVTVAEPACGSGRMVLAANAHYAGCFACANDLDPMCAKMTAINMCLNGAVGQVTCGDGLDIKGDSYRFGYTVMPMVYGMQNVRTADPEKQLALDMTWRMMSLMNPDIQKTYCLFPLKKEDCLIYVSDIPRNLHPESQQTRTTSLKDRLDQLNFLD